MATSGVLKLHVIMARLTHDTELFGKMDPYVVINMRMQRFRTKTAKKGGKEPHWDNEVFELDVKYVGDDMHVEVFDQVLGKDDLIGESTIKISALALNGGLDEWFDIQFKGKDAGKIHFKAEWHPSGEILAEHPVGMVHPMPQLIYNDGSHADHKGMASAMYQNNG